MKNQLELFCDTQDNTAELSATKSITNAQKLKECPMNPEILKDLAEIGLLDKEMDDPDTVLLDLMKELWEDYKNKHHLFYFYGIMPIEERDKEEKKFDDLYDNLAEQVWPTYIRVAHALKTLQEEPNHNVYNPCDYVLELWSIYATDASIEHERAMLYRDFVKCFEGWIKKQREIVTAQYVFNC